jgi:hypothetical protein
VSGRLHGVSLRTFGEFGTNVSNDWSTSEDDRLSETMFSIMSIVRAGETGRLPGIGSRTVPKGAVARSTDREGVCGDVLESISLA